MSEILLDTGKVWDIGKRAEQIQHNIYLLADKLKKTVASLNIIEDILQWSDERVKREADQMKRQADRCGMAARYIFKLAESYEQAEEMIVFKLSALSSAISVVRSENESLVQPAASKDVVAKIKNDKTIGTTQEKLDAMSYILETLIAEGYEMAFIAGVLGNVLHEGVPGKFESSAYLKNPENEPSYLVYVDSKYDYRKKYSGKNIKDMSLKEVYNFVCELEKNGYKGKFGIGSVQWTGDRAKTMIELYMEVASPGDRISEEQIMQAEALMISRELKSAGYKEIYEEWKVSNADNLNSTAAAESAGELICKKYERPRNESAYIARGDDSASIYDVLTSN